MSKIIITTMLAFVAMTGQASWCIPCRREIPNLIAAYNKPPTAPSLPTDFVERTLKRNLQIALRAILSTAAIYLVGLFLWLQQEPAEPVRLAARQPVQEAVVPCTEGTPDEIIMCYLEQRENRPNTFSLIRQTLYENKQ